MTRIIDQLFTFISTYDVLGLKYYWEHLNRRFFQRLDYQHYANVKKLETCLLRLYIVHALQNSKHDKVVEFFEKCASELQQKSEWREWFGKLVTTYYRTCNSICLLPLHLLSPCGTSLLSLILGIIGICELKDQRLRSLLSKHAQFIT